MTAFVFILLYIYFGFLVALGMKMYAKSVRQNFNKPDKLAEIDNERLFITVIFMWPVMLFALSIWFSIIGIIKLGNSIVGD